MKRLYSTFLLCAVCFLLAIPLTANADVIMTPINDFYAQHSSECVFLGRSFYINGEAGFVSVKEAPDSTKEIAVIENGECILIQFTYDYKEQSWGAALFWDQGRPDGWVPMEQLVPVYDYISFEKEYLKEFYPYGGDYDTLFVAGDIVFWAWPGSGEQAWILEEEWRNAETDANFLQATHAYKDNEGREWGFFPYVYGRKNTWVCLNDPGNRDIPAFNPPPQPELWQPQNAGVPQRTLFMPLLIIVLVAAVVVSAAVLIRRFGKP